MSNIEAANTSAASAPDDLKFRDVMARFASGITIVTAVDADGRPHGATVSSFMSVTLQPPTVLVSLTAGRTAALVAENGRYGVSVLGVWQRACSRHFSGRAKAALPPEFVTHASVPTLADSLAWLECRVTRRVVVSDHTLFIAQVEACGGRAGLPLLYFAHDLHEGGGVPGV